MKHVKFLFVVFIMLVIFILLVQNHEAFNTKVFFIVDFKVFDYQTPEINIYLISLIAFILGVVITWFFNLLDRFQLKRQINSQRKELREKDNELNSLRNMPITSESTTSDSHEDDVDLTYGD